MSRPADGACQKCHRALPPEHLREDLVRGADLCSRCAHAKLDRVTREPAAKRWLILWGLGLDSLTRDVARMKLRF